MVAYFSGGSRTCTRVPTPEQVEKEKQLNERDAWNREVDRKKAEKKGFKK